MSEEKNNLKKTYFILGLLIGIAVISTVGFFTLLFRGGDMGLNKQEKKAVNNINNQVAVKEDVFTRLAKSIGLDGDQFSSCLESGKYTSKVRADYDYGASKGVNGTPGNYINGRLIPGALPLENLKQEIDSVLNNTRKLEEGETLVDIAVDQNSDHVRGPENAPVTLVVFDDFQCPYCARHQDSLNSLVDYYGDKLRLAFKHFPLSQIHNMAQRAGEAAECAGEQGKFWEYADTLYVNQSQLTQ